MSNPLTAKNPRVVVRKSAWGAIQARHPWLLANSIEDSSQSIPDGSIVDVVLADGKAVGQGIYNGKSRIRVRVYTWRVEETLDDANIRRRLKLAIQHRKGLSNGSPLEAQRIVFSEADQLSGLVVDKYAGYLMVQFTAAALLSFTSAILEELQTAYQASGICIRIDAQTAKTEGIEPREDWVMGTPPTESILIEDNGLKWRVDLEKGQKTGYYLDQRDNRMAAAGWMPKGGRALDVCCYVGGFALTLAKWGNAAEVVAIDASQRAIETAAAHATLNSIDGVRFEVGDFYQRLQSLRHEGELFDLIVLDPPKMAGSRAELPSALRAYHRLNFDAIQLLKPGEFW